MTQGYLSLVLHAHLPYVRHPEHERFLEENWLFEAVTETYLPLLQVLEAWRQRGMRLRVTLTLSPTLCAMFQDPLLQQRCFRHLEELVALAEKEVHRTRWQPGFHELALMYEERFKGSLALYERWERDLVRAFRAYLEAGLLDIITTAATHAVLPLLLPHGPSVRAQLLIARDCHRACFGQFPTGIWLPECGYTEALEPWLREAQLRWFIVDTHGLLHARPRPRYATFAPVLTPAGLAAFGRDLESARQVWSRHVGYPGDPRYRDFYRDLGFDADYDYVRPYLPAPERRSFTGLKYHRVGGPGEVYDRKAALEAADTHAAHFLNARIQQVQRAAALMPRPPIVICPYDAELFGHWWYEGPEFLDLLARKAFYDQDTLELLSPEDYLERHPQLQLATPSNSSWGEGGYWQMWLNERTEWIFHHLRPAQERMTALVARFPKPAGLVARALKQAGRELLLAQASDWPFILRSGTSPDYARSRVETHLGWFNEIHRELTEDDLNEVLLAKVERQDNLFPEVKSEYWAAT